MDGWKEDEIDPLEFMPKEIKSSTPSPPLPSSQHKEWTKEKISKIA